MHSQVRTWMSFLVENRLGINISSLSERKWQTQEGCRLGVSIFSHFLIKDTEEGCQIICRILLTVWELSFVWVTQTSELLKDKLQHNKSVKYTDTGESVKWAQEQVKDVVIFTLSTSTLPLINSDLQNCSAWSRVSPMPLRKRPYCMRPPWRRWWFSLRALCSCLMQGGKDLVES